MSKKENNHKTWPDVVHSLLETLVWIVLIAFFGLMIHECTSCERQRDLIRHQQEMQKMENNIEWNIRDLNK